LALARVYGFLPRADEEPASSMERRVRRMGVTRWDGSSSSPRNLTLLAGAADNTEEDGQHRGRWTGTWPRGLLLAGPPHRVAGHTCDRDEDVTVMRQAEAGEGDRR
jgi:hypothetical protein